jgi:hypothetical protein
VGLPPSKEVACEGVWLYLGGGRAESAGKGCPFGACVDWSTAVRKCISRFAACKAALGCRRAVSFRAEVLGSEPRGQAACGVVAANNGAALGYVGASVGEGCCTRDCACRAGARRDMIDSVSGARIGELETTAVSLGVMGADSMALFDSVTIADDGGRESRIHEDEGCVSGVPAGKYMLLRVPVRCELYFV